MPRSRFTAEVLLPIASRVGFSHHAGRSEMREQVMPITPQLALLKTLFRYLIGLQLS